MTLPLDPARLPVPARASLPVPALPSVGARLAPVVQATLVAAAAGLGVELALRSVATRAMGALGRNAVSVAPASVVGTTRTVVTEFVIRERVRRFR